jgi:hypothetical protein
MWDREEDKLKWHEFQTSMCLILHVFSHIAKHPKPSMAVKTKTKNLCNKKEHNKNVCFQNLKSLARVRLPTTISGLFVVKIKTIYSKTICTLDCSRIVFEPFSLKDLLIIYVTLWRLEASKNFYFPESIVFRLHSRRKKKKPKLHRCGNIMCNHKSTKLKHIF